MSLDIQNIDGNTFILKARQKEGVFYAWVQVLADEYIAHKYIVCLSVSNKGTTVVEKGKVFPIDLTGKNIMREREGILCFGGVIVNKLFQLSDSVSRRPEK